MAQVSALAGLVTTSSRLNLVSAGDNRELDEVRAIVASFEIVRGLGDVIATLEARARLDARVELLDLVGHARAPGFLVVGSWLVDDSPQTAASFSALLRPSLERLGVRTIRLLGCATAATERARNAIRRIAQATRCQVLGTTRPVGARDYDRAGFASEHALSGATHAYPFSGFRLTTATRSRSEIRGRTP